MNRSQALVLAISLALILLSPIAIITYGQVNTQYMVLASFDFLDSGEISNFENITLDASAWNTTLTTYTVSNGVLNISNSDTKDVFLVYPKTIDGYAEIKLSGDGAVAVLDPVCYNESKIVGYELVKTASDIIVYAINGTSKTTISSLSTTADTIIVTISDGTIRFDLSDGTGIYEAAGEGILAVGAAASANGVIDKITLYGKYLAGEYEIDLGTKTIAKHAHVVTFDFDLSKYDVQDVKIVVDVKEGDPDPYPRWFIVGVLTEDGKFFMKGVGGTIWNNHRWPDPVPTEYRDKYTAIVVHGGQRTYSLNDVIQAGYKKGKIIVGVQTAITSWTASVKIVLTGTETGGGDEGGGEETTTTTNKPIEIKFSNNNVLKYAAIGAFVIIILVLVFSLAGGKRRRAIAPLLLVFMILLILGGISIAVMAWFHPEYLVSMAFGLGAIAIIVLFLLITSGKRIPNPLNPPSS